MTDMGKNKQVKQNKRRSPITVFLVTLSLVLGVGLSFMLIYSKLADRETISSGLASEEKDVKAEDSDNMLSMWERIPEETKGEQAEEAAEGKDKGR